MFFTSEAQCNVVMYRERVNTALGTSGAKQRDYCGKVTIDSGDDQLRNHPSNFGSLSSLWGIAFRLDYE